MSELTYRDILDILRLIDAAPFADVDIEFAGTRVKLTRRPGKAAGGARPSATPANEAPPAPLAVAATPGGGAQHPAQHPMMRQAAQAPGAGSPAAAGRGVPVKPPMAGTFYAAPLPGAPPFVALGRAVRKGDQLGIVEVMKLFTPVVSPCDGIVRAILVGNEQFVRDDQTLMTIEAAE